MTETETTDILAEYERKLHLRSTTRAEAIELYREALAEYEKRKREATVAIRVKLKNPEWRPRTWVALGIGKPPSHPLNARF